MLRICVSGLGRAGKQVAKYLLSASQVKVVSAVCSPESWKTGHKLSEVLETTCGDIPVYSSDRLEECVFNTRPDVAIDFSKPAAALKNAEIFARCGVRLVMGTTGFNKMDEKRLFTAVNAHEGGMVYAPNITCGVNTMMLISELAAGLLRDYDVEVVEMHHKRKLDAPSGTALKIKDNLREARVVSGSAEKSEIPISYIRAGGIVGMHKVLLIGENDMIEISHQSFSRDAFAEGALLASEFVVDKTGVFEMKDVLNYQAALSGLITAKEGAEPPAIFPKKKKIVNLEG